MFFKDIKYLVSKPNEFNDELEYPTVIFMHGAGTRGDDIDKLKGNPFYNDNNILLSHTIVYSPLCNADSWFDLYEKITEFVNYVYNHKNTDKSRLYLVGASMGAYAVWQMLISQPQLYAGAIPICGGGMYWNAARLKDLNIWAFHGKKDSVVLCEESIKMVNNINKYGGNAKITILDNYEHNSWEYVYNNPEPFEWLLKCRKAESSKLSGVIENSSENFG